MAELSTQSLRILLAQSLYSPVSWVTCRSRRLSPNVMYLASAAGLVVVPSAVVHGHEDVDVMLLLPLVLIRVVHCACRLFEFHLKNHYVFLP